MTTTTDHPGRALQRFVPLAGVLVAGLAFAGDTTIGPFPEGTTAPAALQRFYATHGAQVALGGTLLIWSAICFGIFGVAIWARVRNAVPAVVAGAILLGAAVETAMELYSAAVYHFLGAHGADGSIAPAALQAWQLAATEIGSSGGLALMLAGVAVAALGFRAVPRWLGVIGLLLAVALFTPFGFEASLLVLLWAAVAGVVLAVRPGVPAERTRESVAVA